MSKFKRWYHNTKFYRSKFVSDEDYYTMKLIDLICDMLEIKS